MTQLISATHYLDIPGEPQAGEYLTRSAADALADLVHVFTKAASIDPAPQASATLTLYRPLTDPKVVARFEGTPTSILAELHIANTQL